MANINGNLQVVGRHLDLKLESLGIDPALPTAGRVWFDSVTGNIKFGDGAVAKAVGDVSAAQLTAATANFVTDAAMDAAIENALAGLDFQADVLGKETDFVATAGRYIYVDGTTFATGVAAAAGDIVEVDAAGVILSVAYDVSVAGPGALSWSRADSKWYRWDGAPWDVFGGLTGNTAGNGLQDIDSTFSVKPADATIVVDGSGVKVGDLSGTYVTPAAQAAALADYDTSTEVDGKISTAVSGLATSVEVDGKISTAVSGLATAASVTAVADRLVGSWYTVTTSAPNTTHTVTHNIGNRYPVVQVVDKATNKPVVPDSIEFTTANEFVITFASAIDVIVSVIGLKPAA